MLRLTYYFQFCFLQIFLQICPEGHRKSFCTQETIGRSHTGDIRVVSAILLSGNNYEKVTLLARSAKLNMMSSATYSKIQAHYIIPAIEEHWSTGEKLKLKPLKGIAILMMTWYIGRHQNTKPFLLYWGISYCLNQIIYTFPVSQELF